MLLQQTQVFLRRVAVVIFSLSSLVLAEIGPDLTVQTRKGKVRGLDLTTAHGRKVSAWHGIPYAQPPVGNLRFRHPRPIDPWEGVKQTTRLPNSCVQVILSSDWLTQNSTLLIGYHQQYFLLIG